MAVRALAHQAEAITADGAVKQLLTVHVCTAAITAEKCQRFRAALSDSELTYTDAGDNIGNSEVKVIERRHWRTHGWPEIKAAVLPIEQKIRALIEAKYGPLARDARHGITIAWVLALNECVVGATVYPNNEAAPTQCSVGDVALVSCTCARLQRFHCLLQHFSQVAHGSSPCIEGSPRIVYAGQMDLRCSSATGHQLDATVARG